MDAIPGRLNILCRALVALCLLGSFGLLGSLAAASDSAAPTVKIAVFDFELEDLSAASVLLGQSTTGSDSLHKVGEAARKELAKSGRYVVIDPSRDGSEFSRDKALKDCGGCESALASQLGADQSLIGLVRRVSQTDYYVIVQVRDVHSGKVIAQEAANFAGGEEGWASGVRMLIDHQVLPVIAAQPQAQAACKMAEVNPVSGHAECVDPQGAPVDPPPPRDDKS
jgi:ABC-type sugar transport system substrate-binding protein